MRTVLNRYAIIGTPSMAPIGSGEMPPYGDTDQ